MVFISYSWDSKEHIDKISKLVKYLKNNKIEVVWDEDIKLGTRITSFMEDSLQKCDKVLFICTPTYSQKANERGDGVGYETNIITGDLYQNHNDLKYIPILFDGDWDISMPTWAKGKVGVDFRKEISISEYSKLLDALRDYDNSPEILTQEGLPGISQQPMESLSIEERKALQQIYYEILDLKSWLVGLKIEKDGAMKDISGSEDEMFEKVVRVKNLKNTYDFILQENVLKQLNEFFFFWRHFVYIYTHFDEKLADEKANDRNKGKMQKFFFSLFNSSARNDMNYHYSMLKNACNTVLSTIEKCLR